MEVRAGLRVRGLVQGVGFRPFVHGLATRLGLTGFVGNDSDGVFIEAQGRAEDIAAFAAALISEQPPAARIESVQRWPLEARPETAFRIVESHVTADAVTLISPDLCVCDDCLREMRDPADRRYRYPFINCTNCGPRFSIVDDLPYDRPNTTMSRFVMCSRCRAEYEDPGNRRFHAQPIACPECGPRVWFEPTGASRAPIVGSEEAIAAARAALLAGRIVAVKGLGGFHLACDATNRDALRLLRERKGRVDKPFAVMARDLAQVSAFAAAGEAEIALLTSRERPIVLLARRDSPDNPVHAQVAPGNATVGVMLPYTPLHHLLLEGMPPLVMTSGNYSDEPIVKDNAEARARLSAMADGLLLHDRDIRMWCDDSVVRLFGGHELPIRRSRGYAPMPVRMPMDCPALLAVGGELKATFCLTRGRYAFMSQHIGDMENLETLEAFERALAHLMRIFRVEPVALVCDRHPAYLSSEWARRRAAAEGLRLVQVQHHHAHIAAVMAEHGLDGRQPVIGFSFDGTGYGSDGAIWGGEVLVADYAGFSRVAHLRYSPLPGGDAAIRHPSRVALAHLVAAEIESADDIPSVAAMAPAERAVLARQLDRRVNCVDTSSMGRLFDAVASLAGIRHTASYEAQAAIELECLAQPATKGSYEFELLTGAPLQIDPRPVIRAVVADVRAGANPGEISMKFHRAVASVIASVAAQARATTGIGTVALSGGTFQNTLLADLACRALHEAGFRVLTHRKVPPNDGGLALGQAAIAAAQPGLRTV